MTLPSHPNPVGAPSPQDPAWLELVRRQVSSLQFGIVQIIVHDSRVTQIEKTERVRLTQAPPTWR